MWRYTVSHMQLLLRSTKDDEHSSRVDILFKGVSHVGIPTTIDLQSVEEVPATEATGILIRQPAAGNGDKVFALRSPHGTGYVVALAVFLAHDEGEYFETSQFDGI